HSDSLSLPETARVAARDMGRVAGDAATLPANVWREQRAGFIAVVVERQLDGERRHLRLEPRLRDWLRDCDCHLPHPPFEEDATGPAHPRSDAKPRYGRVHGCSHAEGEYAHVRTWQRACRIGGRVPQSDRQRRSEPRPEL